MNVLQGNPNGPASTSSYLEKDLGYKYPYELDLRPGSKLHEKLKNEILRRARESHSVVANRVTSWNEIERVMTAYVEPNEEDRIIKEGNSRAPTSIVFPYSYVIMETVLTYLVMAFLNDPILQFKGVSPEDTVGAIMLEKVIQNQCDVFKVGLSLHTFLRDSIVYGIGAAAPAWEKKIGTTIREDKSGFLSYFRGHGTRVYEEEVIYEGNKLTNIDPYLYLPDPRVPSHRTQDGEFVGWIDLTSRIALMREEKVGEELFNVKYLRDGQLKRTSIFTAEESHRNKKTGVSSYSSYDTRISNPVDVIYMFIDLIPKEWELGDSEYPEKWLFGLANDSTIIKTKKLGLAHGMYPIITASPDFDGYSILPLARSEILYGMQEVLDWLFNSHVSNVRKAINDMLVVDPYLVNIADLKDPQPGKLIRMRRPAWGRGVKDAVQQLGVNDITKQNIADSSFIIQWMQKIGGADDSMMGSLRQGGPERLTGGEFQGTRAGAISRMERVAKVISLQGLKDMAYMFASHTQQLMSKETYINTTGRWQRELSQIFGDVSQMKATPWDLMIDYDVVAKDGTIPGGIDSAAWIRLYDILAKNPQLGSQFDMVKIFEYMALNMGAKNVQDFRISPKIMSDDQINRERQKGNLVPMEGGEGGGI